MIGNYLKTNPENVIDAVDILDKDLSKNLKTALVGYENLSAYTHALTIFPHNDLKKIKVFKPFLSYSEKAKNNCFEWFEMETIFNKLFSEIKNEVLQKEKNNTKDMNKALGQLHDNPNNQDAKKEVKEIFDDVEKEFKIINTTIESTVKKVDSFRKNISQDVINFKEINEKLPGLIEDHKENIKTIRDEITDIKNNIDEINQTIRYKILDLDEVHAKIGKTGIACAFPGIQIFAAIPMAVFLTTKAKIISEIASFNDSLSNSKIKLREANNKLSGIDGQLPTLLNLVEEIPLLGRLAENTKSTAYNIKTAWLGMSSNIRALSNAYTSSKDPNLSERRKRNFNETYTERMKDLRKLINQFENSKFIGIAFDEEAQKNINVKLSYDDYRTENSLFYVPEYLLSRKTRIQK